MRFTRASPNKKGSGAALRKRYTPLPQRSCLKDSDTKILYHLWQNVNSYIKSTLSTYADMIFDTVPILRKDKINSHIAKYGGHPDSIGCTYWADALFSHIKKYLQNL